MICVNKSNKEPFVKEIYYYFLDLLNASHFIKKIFHLKNKNTNTNACTAAETA